MLYVSTKVYFTFYVRVNLCYTACQSRIPYMKIAREK